MDAFRKQKIALRLMSVTLPKDIPLPWLRAAVDLYFGAQIAGLLFWSFLYFRGAYLYLHEHFLYRMVGLSLAISVFGSITKLITFRINSTLLNELFEQLGNFKADTARGRRVRKVISLYELAVAAIIVTHNSGYFFNEVPTRSAPYHAATQTGPAGEVALEYWTTLYCAIITLMANVIGDTIFLMCTNQICQRLLLLADRVSAIGRQQPRSVRVVIKECAQEHVALIGLKNKLEQLYHFIIVVQLSFSFTTICLTLFVIAQFNNFYVAAQELLPQVVSLFLEMFLYCWGGQMMSNHFENLRLAVYNCGWYADCSPEDRSSILIMQTFTTKPVEITSVSIFHLNFHLYETICRETFSYYTIMSQLFGQ